MLSVLVVVGNTLLSDNIVTRAVYISANTLSELSNSVGELYTREHLQ